MTLRQLYKKAEKYGKLDEELFVECEGFVKPLENFVWQDSTGKTIPTGLILTDECGFVLDRENLEGYFIKWFDIIPDLPCVIDAIQNGNRSVYVLRQDGTDGIANDYTEEDIRKCWEEGCQFGYEW